MSEVTYDDIRATILRGIFEYRRYRENIEEMEERRRTWTSIGDKFFNYAYDETCLRYCDIEKRVCGPPDLMRDLIRTEEDAEALLFSVQNRGIDEDEFEKLWRGRGSFVNRFKVTADGKIETRARTLSKPGKVKRPEKVISLEIGGELTNTRDAYIPDSFVRKKKTDAIFKGYLPPDLAIYFKREKGTYTLADYEGLVKALKDDRYLLLEAITLVDSNNIDFGEFIVENFEEAIDKSMLPHWKYWMDIDIEAILTRRGIQRKTLYSILQCCQDCDQQLACQIYQDNLSKIYGDMILVELDKEADVKKDYIVERQKLMKEIKKLEREPEPFGVNMEKRQRLIMLRRELKQLDKRIDSE